MSARTRPRRSLEDILGPPPAPAGKVGRPVADHRQALVLAQAEGQRIKNAKMRGELVPVAEVEAAWASIMLEIRSGVLAIADRVGSRLGDLTPAHLAVIDAEARAVLEALGGSKAPADG